MSAKKHTNLKVSNHPFSVSVLPIYPEPFISCLSVSSDAEVPGKRLMEEDQRRGSQMFLTANENTIYL